MRFILPAVASAAALSVGLAPAVARVGHERRHDRVERSHVSLHLSRHYVLKGERVVVHGKVRPSGRHRVKVVFRGAGSDALETWTKENGTFAMRWAPARTGSFAARAYGVHDRRTSASRSAKRRLTAYRLAGASYYGPGLYGSGVACGGTLL